MSTMSIASPTAIFMRQSRALTAANMKSRYRRTVAGFIWVVLNPMIMFGVQSIIFRHVLKLNVSNYFLFLLSGLLPWIFITQSMDMCTSIFMANGRVLKSFHLNPLVLLTAQLVDNLINFLAAFTLIFIALLLNIGGRASLHGLLFTPIAVVVLLTGVAGLCWLLATAQVFFRDTRFVIQFATSVLFFLTPIFYPADLLPPEYRWFSQVNPLYRLVEPFRITIYNYSWDLFEVSLLKGALVALLLVAAAALLWNRKRSALYVSL
jgi:ABC-type polysaccharide/polyol phosphate export permease